MAMCGVFISYKWITLGSRGLGSFRFLNESFNTRRAILDLTDHKKMEPKGKHVLGAVRDFL